MNRLLALALACCGTSAMVTFATIATAQDDYPNRPIRIVSPFSPGGSTSALGRAVGDRLATLLGQPVIIEDRPGANSILGTDLVAKARADGYTLLLTASTHVTTPLLFQTPYDIARDFVPVATMASTEVFMALHPAVPADNLRDFIALAKSRPGKLNYASGGIGAPPHLSAELLSRMVGISMQHVPYKGSGQYVIDLVGGRVDLAFISPGPAIQFIKAGKLKAIAVSGSRRLAIAPDVPTFREQGLDDFNVAFWYGVFAPAATPAPIVEKLAAGINRVLAMPELKAAFGQQVLDPFISTPAAFRALQDAEWVRYGNLIRSANIKVD